MQYSLENYNYNFKSPISFYFVKKKLSIFSIPHFKEYIYKTVHVA
jgi:hypothetical protein